MCTKQKYSNKAKHMAKCTSQNPSRKYSKDRNYNRVSALPRVDDSQHAPSLEKQRAVPAGKLSNELLWTESATKCILATLMRST